MKGRELEEDAKTPEALRSLNIRSWCPVLEDKRLSPRSWVLPCPAGHEKYDVSTHVRVLHASRAHVRARGVRARVCACVPVIVRTNTRTLEDA
eukprot:250331-Alexandrium_andersonii.AAC.1